MPAIKDNGCAFLLLFYGTVVGLEPALVGTALLIALVFDAMKWPWWGTGRTIRALVGGAVILSCTRRQSRLLSVTHCCGNHPIMVLNAFLYLVVLAVLIRALITVCDAQPALMPELTADYDERTTIQAWRSFWLDGRRRDGGLYVRCSAGAVRALSDRHPRRDGYETGMIGGGVLVAILMSALGTLHPVLLPRRHPEATLGESRIRCLRYSGKSFSLCYSSSRCNACRADRLLAFIMLTYFWAFSSLEFYWTLLVLVSASMGFFIAPWASGGGERRRLASVFGVSVQPCRWFSG